MSNSLTLRVQRMQMKRRRQPPDIDQWLETGLRDLLEPLANIPAPPSRYARLAGVGRSRPRRVGFAGAIFAGLVALTAVSASAATGSVNPVDWGKHASQAVDACKRALPTTGHGIGECVSGFVAANGHGAAADRAAKRARTPGDGPHGASGLPGGASPTAGAGPTANPHTPAKPSGSPHPPQDPAGNPNAHATPPGHGGALPGPAGGKVE
jgi:hypothetical protein